MLRTASRDVAVLHAVGDVVGEAPRTATVVVRVATVVVERRQRVGHHRQVVRLPEMIPDVRVEVTPRVARLAGRRASEVARVTCFRVTCSRVRLLALVLCSVT